MKKKLRLNEVKELAEISSLKKSKIQKPFPLPLYKIQMLEKALKDKSVKHKLTQTEEREIIRCQKWKRGTHSGREIKLGKDQNSYQAQCWGILPNQGQKSRPKTQGTAGILESAALPMSSHLPKAQSMNRIPHARADPQVYTLDWNRAPVHITFTKGNSKPRN